MIDAQSPERATHPPGRNVAVRGDGGGTKRLEPRIAISHLGVQLARPIPLLHAWVTSANGMVREAAYVNGIDRIMISGADADQLRDTE